MVSWLEFEHTLGSGPMPKRLPPLVEDPTEINRAAFESLTKMVPSPGEYATLER